MRHAAFAAKSSAQTDALATRASTDLQLHLMVELERLVAQQAVQRSVLGAGGGDGSAAIRHQQDKRGVR